MRAKPVTGQPVVEFEAGSLLINTRAPVPVYWVDTNQNGLYNAAKYLLLVEPVFSDSKKVICFSPAVESWETSGLVWIYASNLSQYSLTKGSFFSSFSSEKDEMR